MAALPVLPAVNASPLPNTACDQVSPALGPQIRVLMVWPQVPMSFWSFQHTAEIISKEANIPPLGLLTIAALCPKTWTIRLIDQTFEEVRDEDILAADLVMVSGMRVQASAIAKILARARALGRRTMIGGPYASAEPEVLLPLADHVVVGEPDAEFAGIAADLETGKARPLYVVHEKPDVTSTPVPRFDLLNLERYACMAIEFSRGCPFQCEFCDIITIYGRKPRTKYSAQVIAELQALFELGWRKHVFIVDNNFIANHRLALELSERIAEWSQERDRPVAFFTETSLDLAQKPALLDAMVRANFFAVFIGIESPSKESLTETKKFQNLRGDPMQAVRFIQQKGLWVLGGFIIGFDSDTEDIFERQREFIEGSAIPWAMLGFLQAMPTTPLYDRMLKQGRLFQRDQADFSNFSSSNFRTVLPRPILLRGVRDVLRSIYTPASFYDRCLRSLEVWNVQSCQKAPVSPFMETFFVLLRSMWHQGVLADYRKAWWKTLYQLVRRWRQVPLKMWWGWSLLISGHHFTQYARELTEQLDRELSELERAFPPQISPPQIMPVLGRQASA